MDRKYPPREIDPKIHLETHALSHDLKNLLHNILTGIDLLKDLQSERESNDNIITNIEQNAQLAVEMLCQYDSSNNNLNFEKTRIDLKSPIIEIISLLKKNSKVPISFNENVKNQFIIGNYIDIKRILINLINNALESENEKISIILSLDSIEVNQQKFARIIVEDDGPGIPGSNIKNIFEKGFSTKEGNNNSGLGLSIVKDIVDDHKGQIKIKSSLNTGTKFELRFPSHFEAEEIKDIKNKRVIIAEDDEFQREILEDLLKSMKFDVYTASNGIEAYDLFISIEPDIMFLDDNMPGMTGLECAQKIESINTSTRIVLLTGSNIDQREKALKVSKILKKPYRFDMIESTIYELI
ncbi:MAG: hybrid sensor histidine kinase/response regulator [Melioribacteraceae bacterium]|nr:hybrid sensor histidine kinase/response regulator [Melioribacteraceae bacterium]